MSQLTPIIFSLVDQSGLEPETAKIYVGGWINGGAAVAVLTSKGTFEENQKTVPFWPLSSLSQVTLDGPTNGDDRLIFVAASEAPAPLTITDAGHPVQYTQFPYADAPGVAAPGPFDVFEFGLNAQLDVSAVSGFALNISFTVEDVPIPNQFGVTPTVSRSDIATAWKAFIANETKSLPSATAFGELLYDAALPGSTATPPLIDGQFFALCDPNDMLAAKTGNYQQETDDPLASFFDDTLLAFFAQGNYLSINLGPGRIYKGSAAPKTNPQTNVDSIAYSLSNGAASYDFFLPMSDNRARYPGLTGAQYVFQQAFGPLTPAGSAGDAGLLQDCIWEALCRGVALDGVAQTDAEKAIAGYSTSRWNQWSSWYPVGKPSHLYAKFLHCSDKDGNDSRLSGHPPIFYGGAAYGFSMDETPIGPYTGPNVPSKTPYNVSSGKVTVTVGKWQ